MSARLGRAWAVFRLGRPHFLAGGFVLYGSGAALAAAHGAELDLWIYVLGQAVVSAGQLMTHYSNEWVDLPTDRLHRDRPRWSGGSGVLPEGAVSAATARVAAGLSGAVAVGAAIWVLLVADTGAATAVLLAAALALAWGYSAPPLSLHRRGLGEVVGAVLLAILTPLVGYQLQGGGAPLAAVALLTPLAALQFAMLVIVSLPDAPHDAAVGKRTLAVRLGVTAGRRLAQWSYVGACALAAGLAAASAIVPDGSPPGRQGGAQVSLDPAATLGLAAAIAYWLWSPLAVWQIWSLRRRDWSVPAWNALAFRAIAIVVGSAVTLAFAAWLATPDRTSADASSTASAPPDELVIAWVGDVTLGRGVGEFVAAGGDPLAHIAPLLDTADLVVGNLEGPLTPTGSAVGGVDLTGPASAVSLLAGRFDVLGLTNNHALDRGRSGLADSARRLADAGVQVLTPASPSTRFQCPDGPAVTLGAADLASAFGQGAAKRSDLADGVAVVLLHGGTEGRHRPDARQRAAAAALVAAGADAVIGVGPHVTQPVTWLRRPGRSSALVAYSLGNFLFDGPPGAERRGAVLFTGIGPAGIVWAQQIPTLTDGRTVRPGGLWRSDAARVLPPSTPAFESPQTSSDSTRIPENSKGAAARTNTVVPMPATIRCRPS